MKLKMLRTLLLVSVVLISSFVSRAFDFEVDGIYYRILSETEKTVGVASGLSTSSYADVVTIPATVTNGSNTYDVVAIDEYAFYYCSSLKSVNMPISITSIGVMAFGSCSSLSEIDLPSSLKKIEQGAFYECTALTNINIPNSVTEIHQFAFGYCSSLREIAIPTSVTKIKEGTFYGCSALTQIVIPNAVTEIDYTAFADCSGLKSVDIPESVFSIQKSAFNQCVNLSEINVSPNNTVYSSISGLLLNKDATSLILCPPGKSNVTIPESIVTIDNSAVAYCSKLKEIQIPNSVINIGYSAFVDCTNLQSLNIPASVASIGVGIIAGCSSMTEITVEEGNPNYMSIDGVLYNREVTQLLGVPGGKSSINIPNTVTSIENRACYGCTGLTSILFPQNVSTIGMAAFCGCNGFTEIEVPESVTKIEEWAFAYCINIKQVRLPDTITELGGNAFAYCDNLKDIKLPKFLTYLPNALCANCFNLSHVSIPEKVTFIGLSSFNGCPLEDIRIPKSVSSIGYFAFSGLGVHAVYCESTTPPEITYETFDKSTYANASLFVPRGYQSEYETAEYWSIFMHIKEYDFSGIQGVGDESDVAVSAVNGQLIITGAPENALISIYTISGERIYEGKSTVLPVMSPGIYVLKVGTFTKTIRI